MEQQSETRSGSTVIAAVVHAVAVMSPGDQAVLRRLRPSDVAAPAFWRLMATAIDPEGHLGPELRRRWAAVVAAVAQLGDLHERGRRLGASLGEADLAEMRLLRLLRAHDEALWDAVRQAVRFLVSKGADVDAQDIAWLVLTDGRDSEEKTRRAIASDYYRAVQKKASTGESA